MRRSSSVPFSVCTMPMSSKAPASASPPFSASSITTAVECGLRAKSNAERLFTSRSASLDRPFRLLQRLDLPKMSIPCRRRLALLLAVVLTVAATFTSSNAQIIEVHPGQVLRVPLLAPQMVVLLFDLSASAEERERSTAMAARTVMESELRFKVGGDVARVWRIATIGSSVEIAQDFT